jgi:NAD(P)-dependent dehydrogenase (short-subunit alcohol dehydrogenase family)
MTDFRPAALFSLANRTAIVTGSARGLGRMLARGLAAAGANVIVCDRSSDGAGVVAADIAASGGRAAATHVDVTDRASCQQLVAFAVDTFGRLDILVNNAGIDVIEPFEQIQPEHWRQIIDVDLTGPFNCSQYAVARMSAGASIINISSLAATAGIRNLAAYSAAKAGLSQLTRVMALELAPKGIRVNAIAPGYLENVMAGAEHEHADPEKERQIRAFTPLGRRARLDELVGPVIFLASDAASYVTGAVMAVDGGYTAI